MSKASTQNRSSGFFALKHLGLFVCMTLAILAIDVLLLIGIMLFESYISTYSGDTNSPQTSESRIDINEVSDSLVLDDQGSWQFTNQDLLDEMDMRNCWCVLINDQGKVEWTHNTPNDFPTSFTQNDIAVISHDRMYGTYITFIWTKDSDLVMMGYPDTQYLFFGITLSHQAFLRIPLYGLCVLTIDLLLIFLLYVLSQRTLLKNVGPMLGALDDLAQGKPTHVRFTGMLRIVGDRINAVSDTLIRKETARKNWVAGVSHDIRTPLAVAMGHAEQIENDHPLPQATQDSATIIVRQGDRIRNLVEDLNIATQLEYDMQPLKKDTVVLAKLIRSVVVDYLNQDADDHVTYNVEIEPCMSQYAINADERLLKRALRNAIDNALKHNHNSCCITITLKDGDNSIEMAVADNGRGISTEKLAALTAMLERDYLGVGSIVSQTKTSVTFGKTQALIPSIQTPGGPELPTENTSHVYKSEAPIITSQKNPIGITPAHMNSKHPPVPPAVIEEFGSPFEEDNIPFTPDTSWPTRNAPIPQGSSMSAHGLGMPLIARIVLVHDGLFTLESEEGEGMRLIMAFPYSSTE